MNGITTNQVRGAYQKTGFVHIQGAWGGGRKRSRWRPVVKSEVETLVGAEL